MEASQDLKEIIADCQAGSNEAFSRLVDLYASRCYSYFYRLTGNTAQSNDLLSTLFLKLVEKIGTFRLATGSFEKWLFTIASNIFRDHLRRQYRQKKLLAGKAEGLGRRLALVLSGGNVDLAALLKIAGGDDRGSGR